METYLKMLESYRGRDKIMRLISFAAMAGAGGMKGESARRLGTVAGQIGEARTVLRLFDGLPMFKSVLRRGLCSHEKHTLTRLLTLLSTWSIQLFYPCEALAWTGKHKILPVSNPGKWSGLSVATWAIFLLANIVKSLLKIPGLWKTVEKLKKQKVLEGCSDGREENEVIHWSSSQLQHELMTEYLSLLQNMADLLNAVHWLPQGWLWSGKLSMSQSGWLGVASTAVMFYSSFRTPPKQA